MKRAFQFIPICGLLLAGVASGEQISKPHTFSAGTPASAEQVNADFDTVYGQVNKVGAAITVQEQIQVDNVGSAILVDAGGNVGIGTATPAGELHVSKPQRMTEVVFTGGAGGNNMTVDASAYTGTGVNTYVVQVINAVPPVDVIRYSTDGEETWSAPVNMSVEGVTLADNVVLRFAQVDGHAAWDRWDFTIYPGFADGLLVRNGKVTVKALAITGGAAAGQVLTSDAAGNATWQPAASDGDTDPRNELQTITRSGNNVTLSPDGGTVSIADDDSDPTNELQTITRNGTDLILSKEGGTVSIADNDNDPTNEIQTLSLNGSTLALTNGGSVIIDNSSSNELNTSLTLSGTTLQLDDAGGTKSVDLAEKLAVGNLSDAMGDSTSLFIGNGAGASDDGANYNVGVGIGALYANTSGTYNTASGWNALHDTSGMGNSATGYTAMQANTDGRYNTANGFSALYNNTSGSYNIALGANSLKENTNGSGNVGIGVAANEYNQGGSNNTIIGYNAGRGTAAHDKSGNIFLGYQAGFYESGSNKLYIDNSGRLTPLIYGDFAAKALTVNGTLATTGNTTVGGALDISGNGAVGMGAAVSTTTTLVVSGDTDDYITGWFRNLNNEGQGYGLFATANAVTNRDTDEHTGVYGEGGGGAHNYGVFGLVNDLSATTNFGSSGRSIGGDINFGSYGSAANGNTNYGVYGIATGGSVSYGVYGLAYNGTSSNYAGYFAGDLHTTGNLTYVGTLTDTSDERLKENIRPVENGLAKVAALKGVYFNMKDNPGQTEVGVIAQDVQKVLPEAVSVIDKENGYLGVSYPSLIPVLIEAVKELKAENAALKILLCQDHPEAAICQ